MCGLPSVQAGTGRQLGYSSKVTSEKNIQDPDWSKISLVDDVSASNDHASTKDSDCLFNSFTLPARNDSQLLKLDWKIS